MTRTEVQTLIDYHYWARDRMMEAVRALPPEQLARDMGNSFRSIRDTIAHVHGAELLWFIRWQGESPTAFPPADRFPDTASIDAAWSELEGRIRTYLAGLDDRGHEQTIEYRNLAGVPGASVLWQMLQHVVNHASYHRGQVTTMIRQLGAAPPKGMDLITFYRERGDKPA